MEWILAGGALWLIAEKVRSHPQNVRQLQARNSSSSGNPQKIVDEFFGDRYGKELARYESGVTSKFFQDNNIVLGNDNMYVPLPPNESLIMNKGPDEYVPQYTPSHYNLI